MSCQEAKVLTSQSLYTPDGSPGVPGKNDWEENFNAIHLQVRINRTLFLDSHYTSLKPLQRQRWYPSAVVLNNGSILVVGGEVCRTVTVIGVHPDTKPECSLEATALRSHLLRSFRHLEAAQPT